MHKQKLIVVGNGMVGHRFVEELVSQLLPDNYQLTVIGSEPDAAYDRVHLSAYFSHYTKEELSLAKPGYYEAHSIDLRLGVAVRSIHRQEKVVETNHGERLAYDKLILATGSYPWVPPIPGGEHHECHVYRTLQDLDRIREASRHARSGVVIGGGLLGLEAAGALKALGLQTHVVEFAPLLMAKQLDTIGGQLLHREIEAKGISVHTAKRTTEIRHHDGTEGKHRLVFSDGSHLDSDLIVFSTGIRPQDTLAHHCGLPVAERGGIVIDDHCRTEDHDIYAIGECAAWNGRFFGLVAPGYKMAQLAVAHLQGKNDTFGNVDMSTKLKLIGVSVASIGDVHGRTPGARSYLYQNEPAGVYKKLVVSADGTALLGAILVGDVEDYGNLLQMMLNAVPLPENPDTMILPTHAGERPSLGIDALPDTAQICSCFDVTKKRLSDAVASGHHDVAMLKAETRAGTGCGGCVPLMTQFLHAELKRRGISVRQDICEHFPYSRQDLYKRIRADGIKTFDEAITRHGKGYGCEICKPAVGSILASCWNEYILTPQLMPLQDTNDIFLGNMQKDGTYSVIPRMPGGEVTPAGLLELAKVAADFKLYTKVTGAQRIGLFGAHKGDLPVIWERLINAGFETGHAYAKALRAVKTCVGSTWCRYGVQDSVGLGVRLEHRYKGIRAPHKFKIGVSGCTRECAEAQGKDIGVIATEKGWNLYVGGNGGMKPRHADLLATDVDTEALVSLVDRFLMYYIRSADRLQRTANWVDNFEGGIERLRAILVDDTDHIGAELEAEMGRLRAGYACEWQCTVGDEEQLKRFRHFINDSRPDPLVRFVPERAQHRPACKVDGESTSDIELEAMQ